MSRSPWRVLRWALPGAFVLPLVWAVLIEPDRLVLNEVSLRIPGWSLPPLRIAVLSDIHGGAPHLGVAKLEAVVQLANRARPDLTVLLGDYVILNVLGGRFMEPETIAARLAGLRAPLGVVAVLGNHDWWRDGERVRHALETAGIEVLENQARRLTLGGKGLWVAGLADPWTRRVDIEAALTVVPEREPVLLLVHNPDVFPGVPRRVALTLAGHTHGGQVRLPLLGAPIVPSQFGQRYAAGHVVEDGRHLFVTTGIGTSIVPLRLGVPPEVALVTVTGP